MFLPLKIPCIWNASQFRIKCKQVNPLKIDSNQAECLWQRVQPLNCLVLLRRKHIMHKHKLKLMNSHSEQNFQFSSYVCISESPRAPHSICEHLRHLCDSVRKPNCYTHSSGAYFIFGDALQKLARNNRIKFI